MERANGRSKTNILMQCDYTNEIDSATLDTKDSSDVIIVLSGATSKVTLEDSVESMEPVERCPISWDKSTTNNKRAREGLPNFLTPSPLSRVNNWIPFTQAHLKSMENVQMPESSNHSDNKPQESSLFMYDSNPVKADNDEIDVKQDVEIIDIVNHHIKSEDTSTILIRSPESNRKQELCSYLKLMNMDSEKKIPKVTTRNFNRRSKRVENLMEKKKIVTKRSSVDSPQKTMNIRSRRASTSKLETKSPALKSRLDLETKNIETKKIIKNKVYLDPKRNQVLLANKRRIKNGNYNNKETIGAVNNKKVSNSKNSLNNKVIVGSTKYLNDKSKSSINNKAVADSKKYLIDKEVLKTKNRSNSKNIYGNNRRCNRDAIITRNDYKHKSVLRNSIYLSLNNKIIVKKRIKKKKSIKSMAQMSITEICETEKKRSLQGFTTYFTPLDVTNKIIPFERTMLTYLGSDIFTTDKQVVPRLESPRKNSIRNNKTKSPSVLVEINVEKELKEANVTMPCEILELIQKTQSKVEKETNLVNKSLEKPLLKTKSNKQAVVGDYLTSTTKPITENNNEFNAILKEHDYADLTEIFRREFGLLDVFRGFSQEDVSLSRKIYEETTKDEIITTIVERDDNVSLDEEVFCITDNECDLDDSDEDLEFIDKENEESEQLEQMEVGNVIEIVDLSNESTKDGDNNNLQSKDEEKILQCPTETNAITNETIGNRHNLEDSLANNVEIEIKNSLEYVESNVVVENDCLKSREFEITNVNTPIIETDMEMAKSKNKVYTKSNNYLSPVSVSVPPVSSLSPPLVPYPCPTDLPAGLPLFIPLSPHLATSGGSMPVARSLYRNLMRRKSRRVTQQTISTSNSSVTSLLEEQEQQEQRLGGGNSCLVTTGDRSHCVCLKPENGPIVAAYYVDRHLIVRQPREISCWMQSSLGSVMQSQQFWIGRGSLPRVAFEGSVERRLQNSIIRTDDAVAYVELWIKEHKSVFRERPVADVFAVIYYWKSGQKPEKKVLQLENIKGYANDVQCVIMKRSRHILVSWSILAGLERMTVLHAYQLATDYQNVIGIREMMSVSAFIDSLHTIENSDLLIMGCSKENITIWNIDYGYVVAKIDMPNPSPESKILWNQCDQGYLFLIQECSEGNLRLIAVNGSKASSKNLKTFKPSPEFKRLLGVSNKNGILSACYENGILSWNIETGELLTQDTITEGATCLLSDNHVIITMNDQVHVKHMLYYLLTGADI